MRTISFRTADGRKVSFKVGKNPPRRKAATKKRPAAKRTSAKRKTTQKTSSRSCKTVQFKAGPSVEFCRAKATPAQRAAKKRRGKTLYKKNGLSKNAFVKGPSLTGTQIPKGKRSGDVFKNGKVTYRVISYTHPASGKRVRYALRVKATAK
jgi:hypothetical protein